MATDSLVVATEQLKEPNALMLNIGRGLVLSGEDLSCFVQDAVERAWQTKKKTRCREEWLRNL